MLSYEYVEYQHIQIHLFSSLGESNWSSVLPRVFQHTVMHYAQRVLDVFFNDGSYSNDGVLAYLYKQNARPRTIECHKTYFRTRFHPVSTSSVNASVLDDVWLHRHLHSIPPEHRDTYTWLSSLLHPVQPDTFRNNPVRHIIAYRGNTSLEDMQFMSRWLSKLHAYHYHTQSETNQITLPMSKHPEYLSFDRHTMTTLSIDLPTLVMDEFVFETEPVDVEVHEMEQEREVELTKEEREKNVRCEVVIRYGVRKGETCNRVCKTDMTACGIHSYTSK